MVSTAGAVHPFATWSKLRTLNLCKVSVVNPGVKQMLVAPRGPPASGPLSHRTMQYAIRHGNLAGDTAVTHHLEIVWEAPASRHVGENDVNVIKFLECIHRLEVEFFIAL